MCAEECPGNLYPALSCNEKIKNSTRFSGHRSLKNIVVPGEPCPVPQQETSGGTGHGSPETNDDKKLGSTSILAVSYNCALHTCIINTTCLTFVCVLRLFNKQPPPPQPPGRSCGDGMGGGGGCGMGGGGGGGGSGAGDGGLLPRHGAPTGRGCRWW